MERVWMLLLPLCSGQNYEGTVFTYLPLESHSNGSVTVEFYHKWISYLCHDLGLKDFPPEILDVGTKRKSSIDFTPSNVFCQEEIRWTLTASSTAPFLIQLSQQRWFSTYKNGVVDVKGSILLDLRTRSDTGKPNTSPQTTVLPLYSVMHNCPADIRLLNFDPDGDLVQCRFANKNIDPSECEQCTPPSVLSLTPDCTLSFKGTNSSSVGNYAVQLVMEDFPRSDIVLTQTNGSQTQRKTTNAISKIPVQFTVEVVEFDQSCSPGDYVPKLEEPTPKHGSQISAVVNQALNITTRASSSQTRISDLRVSGPSGMKKSSSGENYTLSWTPEETDEGRSFLVCFESLYLSEMTWLFSGARCVTVSVGMEPPPEEPPKTLKVFRIQMQSTARLTDEKLQAAVMEEVKKKLKKQGVTADVCVSVVNGQVTRISVGKQPTCPKSLH